MLISTQALQQLNFKLLEFKPRLVLMLPNQKIQSKVKKMIHQRIRKKTIQLLTFLKSLLMTKIGRNKLKIMQKKRKKSEKKLMIERRKQRKQINHVLKRQITIIITITTIRRKMIKKLLPKSITNLITSTTKNLIKLLLL